jgi:hypothetical protein
VVFEVVVGVDEFVVLAFEVAVLIGGGVEVVLDAHRGFLEDVEVVLESPVSLIDRVDFILHFGDEFVVGVELVLFIVEVAADLLLGLEECLLLGVVGLLEVLQLLQEVVETQPDRLQLLLGVD